MIGIRQKISGAAKVEFANVLLTLFLIGGTAFFTSAVMADDNRPLYIAISEVQPNTYKLQWRVPPTIPGFNLPALVLPSYCQNVGHTLKTNVSKTNASREDAPGQINSAVGQFLYQCEQSLAGGTIEIQYPAFNPPAPGIIKFQALSGERHTALLEPRETSWQIPAAETTSSVARDYTLLGIEHIWAGVDHLLFLMCLIWIAGSLRRILVTVTGFTLAHSVTLVMSALQVVKVAVPPVEASIALSIVFLATEIARGRRHSLTWRYPVAVSSAFGLLHGFGFAAALRSIGLPQTELVTGLLFFNVGVEIGQVVFVVAVATLFALIRHAARPLQHGVSEDHARVVAAYVVGAVSSLWLIERCMAFLPSGV